MSWKSGLFAVFQRVSISADVVKAPTVSLYSVASKPRPQEKQPLLCVASDMYPPETQLSWRKRRQGGSEEEVPAEEEQLELREGGRTSSIMMRFVVCYVLQTHNW
uniref:Ig-like domain-containing protein n=1 Tax=Fundulus heteroclitus TaxID=8078 RepID=A0A3Q2QW92_FUNHE